jgi:hypothetical protein
MAGKLFFDSYAASYVKGDLAGQVTATSYFNLLVTGKFTGKIATKSYAVIYLLGGLGGEVELGPSRLWVAGRTTKADLARVKGARDRVGEIYLEESDLLAGTSRHGQFKVTVGKSIAAQ